MSQHILNIVDQTASNARVQINLALTALGSTNSGSTEPPTSFNNQLWYDTGTNTLKLKEEVGSGWISIGYFDQGSGAFSLFDDTKVVNSSGTQTALLGDQATSTWEAGTGTLESLVSPDKIKAAIEANVELPPVKAWVNFSGIGSVSIRASSNVSSVADNSTGDYTVNFTTAFSSANYASHMSAGSHSVNLVGSASGRNTLANRAISGKAAGSCRFLTGIHTGAPDDFGDVSFTAIGA